MSPRSDEFMNQAHEALRAARMLVAGEVPGRAVSESYFAMLYAARAALSEVDRHARSHKGTWMLLWEHFVLTGRVDSQLAEAAQKAQQDREGADYDAAAFPPERAAAVLVLAEGFVGAVEAALLDG